MEEGVNGGGWLGELALHCMAKVHKDAETRALACVKSHAAHGTRHTRHTQHTTHTTHSGAE